MNWTTQALPCLGRGTDQQIPPFQLGHSSQEEHALTFRQLRTGAPCAGLGFARRICRKERVDLNSLDVHAVADILPLHVLARHDNGGVPGKELFLTAGPLELRQHFAGVEFSATAGKV